VLHPSQNKCFQSKFWNYYYCKKIAEIIQKEMNLKNVKGNFTGGKVDSYFQINEKYNNLTNSILAICII